MNITLHDIYQHAGLLPSARDPVENGYEDILEKLNEYLKKYLENYIFLEKKMVALKFKMKHLEVDLLLSPRWSNRDELFTYLRQISPKKRLM